MSKEINLSPRQVCDLEMIMNGGFAPLGGFLSKADYESVCKDMRLKDGSLWPIPITLDVDEKIADELKENDKISLRDQEGVELAELTVGDIWKPDKQDEAQQVFGTTDTNHPAVDYLLNQADDYYIGGKVTPKELPSYYDFVEHRYTPKRTKRIFQKNGLDKSSRFSDS